MKRLVCLITALTVLGLSWAAIGSAEETGAAQILTAEETGVARRQVPGRNVYPFDYDEENNSVREFDPPTYAEAVSAVARLSLIGGLAGER